MPRCPFFAVIGQHSDIDADDQCSAIGLAGIEKLVQRINGRLVGGEAVGAVEVEPDAASVLFLASGEDFRFSVTAASAQKNDVPATDGG